MKKQQLILLLSIGSVALSDAQVKRQYQDANFKETTVVIKEEAGMSDADILNANFDLAEVPMGAVVRITTEKDRPVIEEDSVSAPETFTAEVPEELESEIVVEVEQTQEQKDQIVLQKVVNNPLTQTTIRSASTRSSSASSSRVSSMKKKKKIRFFKLKKRKKPKKGRFSKCYSF